MKVTAVKFNQNTLLNNSNGANSNYSGKVSFQASRSFIWNGKPIEEQFDLARALSELHEGEEGIFLKVLSGFSPDSKKSLEDLITFLKADLDELNQLKPQIIAMQTKLLKMFEKI